MNGGVQMNDRVVLQSPEPLEDGIRKWRKLYWIALPFLLLGWLDTVFFGIGVVYLLILLVVLILKTEFKEMDLRCVKFLFISGVSYDDVFSKLQPVLLSKYGNGFMIERNETGGIKISYAGLYYDLVLENDYFRIEWGMSTIMFVFRRLMEYLIYRKILVAMGIIGYELQAAYGIQQNKEAPV
jgi:hypothetical protein